MKEAFSGINIENTDSNKVRENRRNSFPQEGAICDFTQQFPPMLTTEIQETESGSLHVAISDGSRAEITPETQEILQESNVPLSTVETILWSYFSERNKNNFIKYI